METAPAVAVERVGVTVESTVEEEEAIERSGIKK
jgi:hypothetical protein